jgi:hypothetical protein
MPVLGKCLKEFEQDRHAPKGEFTEPKVKGKLVVFMSRSAKKRGRRKSMYMRISLSIPRKLWGYFERTRKLPIHAGNRSSVVRSLLLEKLGEQ